MDIFTLKTAILAAATAVGSTATASPPTSDPITEGRAHLASTAATFEPYREDSRAVTYDEELVPTGADVNVSSWPSQNGSTAILLSVQGLIPERTYGAHVHTGRCGPDPSDAGPHFQHVPDPVTPSVDPAYANPNNEIWLDFTTDVEGSAYAASTVPWQFTDRHAQAVVVHVDPTQTAPEHAGMAGLRVGCVNVDF